MKSQQKYQKTFSFELFPPKTDAGMEKLKACVNRLQRLRPLYFSVTYGAGGSTQERTFETVDWLRQQGIGTAPHLSCVGSSKDQIRSILSHYMDKGIDRIVALRGDMPSGMGAAGDFPHANDLVEFIRAETGDHFCITVAAYPEFHPQAPDALTDLKNFRRKVKAGANEAITQYFYSADAYFHFVANCEAMGMDLPIVPGIMPILNFAQLARFSDACGAEIPRWIRRRMQGFGDDTTSIRAFGVEVVTELCQRLLDQGAPGLHFYTMNQSSAVEQIWANLKLSESLL
ncbi:MAG: methylenetetrahydrofolate reductase [NAD(P)H] [Gammaproteobacteria bacterium]|nr:methylenetetrahydrofolate reductase [NAD(P)H] [Gammaproteobacteria bacterium]MCP5406443.1 methylenetetrahydrofolate reductase [NAD(P)H] [Chromatiaceae bacterium]MCP5408111.1 methylenetetrahydrofolate reductase [NAD(P)H] [Chromatiaceae bacterium]MCP5443010.1 methylenetetrahydrofolate reductase [NAD(P)H] [Chromatiaceae bacterium]